MQEVNRQDEPVVERPLRPFYTDCVPVCMFCASDAHDAVDCPLMQSIKRQDPIDKKTLTE